MAILAVTQKVDINDDNLGFFHQWLAKLAEKEKVFVITNFAGKYNLPKNVEIFSLGKEKGRGFIARFFRYQYFLLNILPKVNGVFFHMCPEYVIGAGFYPKILRKKTLLWYAHKQAGWKLRLAEQLVDKIFTPSFESFRLISKKVEITGHGIDLVKFSGRPEKNSGPGYRIISAGRIAPIKNYEVLIKAAEILKKKDFDFTVEIAGAPILKNDKKYFQYLKDLIFEKGLADKVFFVGPVSYQKINEFYWQGDLFVNFSGTGSIDKAVLEAVASGCLVLTSNEAFGKILPKDYFCANQPEEIADKIISFKQKPFDLNLQSSILSGHKLDKIRDKIIFFLSNAG